MNSANIDPQTGNLQTIVVIQNQLMCISPTGEQTPATPEHTLRYTASTKNNGDTMQSGNIRYIKNKTSLKTAAFCPNCQETRLVNLTYVGDMNAYYVCLWGNCNGRWLGYSVDK